MLWELGEGVGTYCNEILEYGLEIFEFSIVEGVYAS